MVHIYVFSIFYKCVRVHTVNFVCLAWVEGRPPGSHSIVITWRSFVGGFRRVLLSLSRSSKKFH